MDDFAWLGLKQEIASIPDGNGWKLLFEPRAQGTVRLFSERLYFWILHSIFGLDPLPFRVIAFGVQFLNLWLLMRITSRLTKSWIAGTAAAFFFAVSAHAAKPLAWASSFNQILAACCMLAAFHWFLDWIETGKPRFWWMQFVIFLLSFGVLESAIVYPAIATLWTLLFARHRLRGSLPLWIPSAAFAALHLYWIPRPASVLYTPLFDTGMLASLVTYTRMALGSNRIAIGLAVLLFSAVFWRGLHEKDWKPLFFYAWFVTFLTPVLPFQNRIADYYLVLPSTGLALCIGCLLRGKFVYPGAAALAVFAWTSAITAQVQLDWLSNRSERIHRVFDAAGQLVKTKNIDTLLLSGVDTDLFMTALQDSPFRLLGLTRVYLVPGSESAILSRADLGGVNAYRITLPQAIQALESGSAAVLSITADQVFDATARYKSVAMTQYLQGSPRSVNVGEHGYESLLGPGWWPIEDKFRWMAKTASVTLGAPGLQKKDRLHISGFCPPTVAAAGPITLTVRANGTTIGQKTLTETAAFTATFVIPKVDTQTIRIDLEVSRVTRLAGDKRDLGLIFGTFSIHP